jgi:IS5 family transposase
MCELIGIALGCESFSGATTSLKFRRRLEQNDLNAALLAEVNAQLSGVGLLMRQGTVVEATTVARPSLTKIWRLTRLRDASVVIPKTVR